MVAPPIEIRVWEGGGALGAFLTAVRRGGQVMMGDRRWVVVRQGGGGTTSAVGGRRAAGWWGGAGTERRMERRRTAWHRDRARRTVSREEGEEVAQSPNM
jgi:hypothetical protein